MKNKEDLIYDLIFSETLDYNINISDYIDDIYKYDIYRYNAYMYYRPYSGLSSIVIPQYFTGCFE